MVEGLIGKKVGMTQVFDEAGRVVPVTVIKAGPCVVVQRKTADREGYDAVQLGLVEGKPSRKITRPMEGHFKKAGVPPTRILREFQLRVEDGDDEGLKPGDHILVKDVFRPDDRVDVSGRTIGRGFQGVIRRHGFAGGRATHGSMFHRAPGSIGASADPSRVYPGTKLPGQMGHTQVMIRKLRVVDLDEEDNLLLVKGAVPGSRGGYVFVTMSR